MYLTYKYILIDPSQSENTNSGSTKGLIIGLIVLSLLLFIFIVIIGIIWLKQEKHRQLLIKEQTELKSRQSMTIEMANKPIINNSNSNINQDNNDLEDSQSNDELYNNPSNEKNVNTENGLISMNSSSNLLGNKLDSNNINNNYNKWTTNEFIDWIISLDKNRLIKYKDILNNNLIKQNVKGDNINDITKTDLKEFGLIDFSDRAFVFKSINKLKTHKIQGETHDN